MITIRHNTYNDGELEKLLFLFEQAQTEFAGQRCRKQRCFDCDVRHICYDLDRVCEYLRKQKNK